MREISEETEQSPGAQSGQEGQRNIKQGVDPHRLGVLRLSRQHNAEAQADEQETDQGQGAQQASTSITDPLLLNSQREDGREQREQGEVGQAQAIPKP